MRPSRLVPLLGLCTLLGLRPSQAEDVPLADERVLPAQAPATPAPVPVPRRAVPPATSNPTPTRTPAPNSTPTPTTRPATPPAPIAPVPNPSNTPFALSDLTGTQPNPFSDTSDFSTPGLTSPERFSRAGIPQMLGDQAPLIGPPQHTATGALRLPWVRGYKMADNQSPRPQDRVFVTFNFYDNVNPLLNSNQSETLRRVKIYREFFGIEKTFLDQNASIGLRLPVNTMVYGGTAPGAGRAYTAAGDLVAYAKYILWQDQERKSLVTLGMAFGLPTGPSAFAGAPITHAPNPFLVQPFVGYIKGMGDWFVQGFTGVDVPTDGNVVTIMYNDVGLGYYFRRETEGCIRGIVPTFEVHVNTPLNHQLSVGQNGALGTPNVVDLTFGTSFVMSRSVLSVGVVDPVTGPRPFTLEAVVNLNIFYGATRRSGLTLPPPTIGP